MKMDGTWLRGSSARKCKDCNGWVGGWVGVGGCGWVGEWVGAGTGLTGWVPGGRLCRVSV